APAFRKRFGDFQPDHGAAVSLLFQWCIVIAWKEKGSWRNISSIQKRQPIGCRLFISRCRQLASQT
ncbi:hypothetical protein, partial [Enterobacter soli]|uniref:hypothetical protein n=1 Tax=Enterobacter soli TaxID=885040 RepID=UPI0037327EAA